jgi:hypothetical protein
VLEFDDLAGTIRRSGQHGRHFMLEFGIQSNSGDSISVLEFDNHGDMAGAPC